MSYIVRLCESIVKILIIVLKLRQALNKLGAGREYVQSHSSVITHSQKLTYAGHPIAVHSEEALEEMLNAFDADNRSEIQFSVIESEDTLFSVKEHHTNDARFEYKTFTFGGVTEYMIYK